MLREGFLDDFLDFVLLFPLDEVILLDTEDIPLLLLLAEEMVFERLIPDFFDLLDIILLVLLPSLAIFFVILLIPFLGSFLEAFFLDGGSERIATRKDLDFSFLVLDA